MSDILFMATFAIVSNNKSLHIKSNKFLAFILIITTLGGEAS